MGAEQSYVRWFDDLGADDIPSVGGKNASLGEMIGALQSEGIRVPGGFATTAEAYREFVEANELGDRIDAQMAALDEDTQSLEEVGRAIRRLFLAVPFPEPVKDAVGQAYRELSQRYDENEVDVAARSSATAEDLPEASFAGQQETFLNIRGEEELFDACRKCYASLFTDRAIAYRQSQGYDYRKVALSVGVQKMVRADKGGSGVMFTIDTETGFPDVIVIDAAWGLGENVVQGTVNPDEYRVFKPLLKQEDRRPIVEMELGDKEKKLVYSRGKSRTTRNVDTPKEERRRFVLGEGEILRLARWGALIEEHYGKPMDIEWARDGESGDLHIVQARPETIQSQKQAASLRTYRLQDEGERLLTGQAIGQAIAAGKALVLKGADEIERFEAGAILVTEATDPDWVPIMEQAAGIVTDHGGRTSHAAIVSRELGVPAVVGTEAATEALEDGQKITLSCAEGDEGFVYAGELDFEAREVDLEGVPETETKIMINIAAPPAALRWWRLPCDGVGLARMEFIISRIIQAHPLALLHFDELKDESARSQIEELTRGYDDKADYFVEHLARGIGKIAAPHYPNPVIVRLSDLKTNEYSGLIGGDQFEPEEENPMLGWRGAARYVSEGYREGFDLECRAIRRVREEIGLDNLVVMIPFCRTPDEADQVLKAMSASGLERGQGGLEVYVMCEIPANVLLAGEFAERFDGFSIGTNDLTQLVLGVDRDSAELAGRFDERNEAVRKMVAQVIEAGHAAGRHIGICGQAPSDYPEFAEFLVRAGIDSLSLNPDSFFDVKRRVAEVEGQLTKRRAGRG